MQQVKWQKVPRLLVSLNTSCHRNLVRLPAVIEAGSRPPAGSLQTGDGVTVTY